MIKYCAGEWGHRSIDKIMQVFGGTGETLDLPIAHWYHLLRHAVSAEARRKSTSS